MEKDYQVVDSSSKLDSRELAEFLSKEGQLLLPLLDLVTQGQRAIDEVSRVPTFYCRWDIILPRLNLHSEARGIIHGVSAIGFYLGLFTCGRRCPSGAFL